jgi:hypothetical protein
LNLHKKWRSHGNHGPSKYILTTSSTSDIPPIFNVRVVFEQGKLQFSPKLEDFQVRIPSIIMDLVECVGSIPSLEVETVKYGHTELLNSINPEETEVKNSFASIQEAIDYNVELLRIYRNVLSNYEETLTINHSHHVQTFASKKLSLPNFKAEMEKSIRYQESIQDK